MAKRHHRILWTAVIGGTLVLVCMVFVGAILEDLFPQPMPMQSARWLLKSRNYKREALLEPTGLNGKLKHIEWDGWGWGGNDTTVYLVFDPDNALARAATSGLAGKYPGIPCEVYRVRRLEDNWYTVQFYTGSDWNNCS
jgi:hypothetical protein